MFVAKSLAEVIEELVREGLFPNVPTVIAQLLATLILFLVLKKLVWKPMTEFLNKRQEVIIGELESAKQANNEANQLKQEYEEALGEAKTKAQNIVETAKIQAEERKEVILEEAKKEANYTKEKALLDIEQERAIAEKELKEHVVEVALEAAEKIINENVNNETNRKMINDFIKEVGE